MAGSPGPCGLLVTARGIFVTGTDTGVGKTVVSCALVRALRARGVDAGAMKAMETGVGAEGALDARALAEAAGDVDPPADVCPLQFALPAAPNVAAAHEGAEVDLPLVRAAFGRLARRHRVVVVEGAGGLLVPTRDDATMADLANDLGLPLLLVARASLGTINHTRLSLAEIERRRLPLAGVVVSHSTGELSLADRANFDHLRAELGDRLLGEVPPLGPGEDPGADWLRLDPLLALLR